MCKKISVPADLIPFLEVVLRRRQMAFGVSDNDDGSRTYSIESPLSAGDTMLSMTDEAFQALREQVYGA